MRAADANQVPAGGALAVDRDGSPRRHQGPQRASPDRHQPRRDRRPAAAGLGNVHHRHRSPQPLRRWPTPSVTLGRGRAGVLRCDRADRAQDSIDMSAAWFQSRYDKVGPGGTGADYINCRMNKEQYDAFVDALVAGEKGPTSRSGKTNTPYFDGCLPIEVNGRARPRDAAPWPMKPVGLTNPHNPTVKAYAIVQLRQDNKLGTLYNMVGFQTKLKYGAQQRVPHHSRARKCGIRKARLACIANTFLNSPKLLDAQLRLRAQPSCAFAGANDRLRRLCGSASIG